MKKRLYYLLAILFALPLLSFANNPDGYWYNQDYNVEILVETTRDGIRVKRSDKRNWYNYEKVARNRYEDYRRNTYKIKNDQIIWESNDGRQYLRFDRMRKWQDDRDRYYEDDWGNSNTCGHQGHCDCYQHENHHGQNVGHRHGIEGKWYSGDRRTYIKVSKAGRSYIKVKTKHSSLKYRYRRIADYTYQDHRGNILKFTRDGRALLKTPHRRKKFVYYRS